MFHAVGIEASRERVEVGRERTHEAVVAVEYACNERGVARVVVFRREAPGEHDRKGIDHRHGAEKKRRINEREEDPRLEGFAFAVEYDAHGGHILPNIFRISYLPLDGKCGIIQSKLRR